jgi:uncharacterized protein HemY
MSTVKVKVKVSTLISHLEKALAEREARYKNQEKEQAKYEKAVEAYNLAVLKLIKAGKGEVEEASRNHYYERHAKNKGKTSFSVTILLPVGSLPDEPERPDTYNDYEWKREREEITQAIRVLKLTEEQFVSASTYASVAKYL